MHGEIDTLVEQVADAVVTVIVDRVKRRVFTRLGLPLAAAPAKAAERAARRKGPIQLCPVPGCKNRAAPSLGMVCSTHKSVSKAKIKLYREQRRKAKSK